MIRPLDAPYAWLTGLATYVWSASVGIISMAAMTPWLTQVEQHFALYVANGVKMFLFMTPLIAAWFVIARIFQHRHSDGAGSTE